MTNYQTFLQLTSFLSCVAKLMFERKK